MYRLSFVGGLQWSILSTVHLEHARALNLWRCSMCGGRCGPDNGTLATCWQHYTHCLISTSRDSKGKVRILATFVQFGVVPFIICYYACENTSCLWYKLFLSCLRLFSCSFNCHCCHQQAPWLKPVVSQFNLFCIICLSLNLLDCIW